MGRPVRSQVLVERWSLFDTWVDGFTIETFIAMLRSAVVDRKPALIVNHNVNSLAQFLADDQFRSLYQRADHCFIDGATIIALLRLSGWKARYRHRLAVLDWMNPVFSVAEREGWRVTHLGADETVMAKAQDRILADYPELRLTLIDGFFDMSDKTANESVIDRVMSSSPDVLLVGMGMPRQERWLLENYDDLKVPATITVGGAFGYLGGSRRTPPRWLGRMGLEWLYRVLTEPRRLWRRYLLEPIPLLPRVMSLASHAVSRVATHRFRRR